VSWVHVAGKRVQKQSVMDRVVTYAFPDNSAFAFKFRITANAYITCNHLYS
jgi:hypothetical protein